MRNAGQDEAQAEIKIARRNINNLRYAELPLLLFSLVLLCDPMDCSMPGFSVHHLLELAQTHVR